MQLTRKEMQTKVLDFLALDLIDENLILSEIRRLVSINKTLRSLNLEALRKSMEVIARDIVAKKDRCQKDVAANEKTILAIGTRICGLIESGKASS